MNFRVIIDHLKNTLSNRVDFENNKCPLQVRDLHNNNQTITQTQIEALDTDSLSTRFYHKDTIIERRKLIKKEKILQDVEENIENILTEELEKEDLDDF